MNSNPQNTDHNTSQSDGSGRVDQPEYGQYAQPEYGQMASRYPGWNPYVYGAPEPDKSDGSEDQSGKSPDDMMNGADGNPGAGNGYSSWPGSPQSPDSDWRGAGQPQSPYRQYPQYPNGGRGNGYVPDYWNGIDMNDPNQNPLYGRWDSAAIVAFVSALISIPVMPVILGAFSIWRTGRFHMKGRGLAVAAVIMGLLVTALDLYLMVTGMDPTQLVLQMYGLDSTGGTGGTDGGTSV
ncbi:hypothetical protein EP30_08975 [Bifidobacterium sp. UTCIF-39]|uniref:DUF4190 domain-containing protein n=1 Tax=Bifidobacterium sp. UTCIF-39 TaxID=1465359 RepID=UPI00112A4C37|nr:DUF4190 domain-containing protein [Bifidobacterium sp. UTCIF-39]TPF96169.1 hypothetical protein EP30_08975 [Bifidobacterium sp. UTCIF-39]